MAPFHRMAEWAAMALLVGLHCVHVLVCEIRAPGDRSEALAEHL
jgi:hypothetical protein